MLEASNAAVTSRGSLVPIPAKLSIPVPANAVVYYVRRGTTSSTSARLTAVGAPGCSVPSRSERWSEIGWIPHDRCRLPLARELRAAGECASVAEDARAAVTPDFD